MWPVTTPSNFLAKQDHFRRWSALQWNIYDNTCLFTISSLGQTPNKDTKDVFATTAYITRVTLRYTATNLSAASNISPNSLLGASLSFQWRPRLQQGMQCHSVFLNKCSTFPSSRAHTPPSPLFISCQRIQSPSVNQIELSKIKKTLGFHTTFV